MSVAAGGAVIALHGFLGCQADWEGALATLGRTALSVALPGHVETVSTLLSAAERDGLMAHASIDVWADGLAAALRRAGAADAPVDVLGYSLGGRVSIALADRHPALVRRLVLVSTSLGIEHEAQRVARAQLDQQRAAQLRECEPAQLRAWLIDWYRQPLFATLASSPTAFAAMIEQRSANDAGAVADVVAALSPGVAPFRGSWAGRTTIPTLWIAGANDPRYAQAAERVVDTMNHARAVIVAGGGHALLATHGAEVGRAAASWLSSALP